MKKTLLNTLTVATLFFASAANAQVGIGVPAGDIHPSAELEVKSSTKGFLPPRMTKAQRLAMIAQGSNTYPAAGLLVFQTDGDANEPTGLYFFDGTAWRNGAGVVGAKGDQGIQGPKGDAGAIGPKGETGLNGLPGATGPAGSQGIQGLPGANGAVGAAGPTGSTGLTGSQGATGAAGQGGVTTAGSGINVTGAGTIASPYVVSTTNPCGLAIGQTYQGGIIFYLDASGCHGLISAPTDQSTGIHWYNGNYTVTNAVRDGVGAGKFNTERIIANQGVGNYAAQLCANYQGGNYGDWYLPSKYELNLMYQNIGQGNTLGLVNVGGFANNYYWSSTEYDNGNAWSQAFNYGGQNANFKVSNNGFVRSVRAF